MTGLHTGRYKLPLLAVSQGQKEVTHNEALVLVDALLHMSVEDTLSDALVPTDEDIGKCWLIIGTPTGAWVNKSGQIGVWIGGSWRFLTPQDGMGVWNKVSGCQSLYSKGQWISAIDRLSGRRRGC